MTGQTPVSLLKKTPLNQLHKDHAAKMVDFFGWELPLYFESILKEHESVRSRCGVFDVSHMGRLKIEGPSALELLQKTNTNDISSLKPGQALYSHMPSESGGIIDDLIVSCLSPNHYYAVVNASRIDADKEWIEKNNSQGVVIADQSPETAMIAVQGPMAEEILSRHLKFKEAQSLPRFGVIQTEILNCQTLISRTGYTGEDGFEIVVSSQEAPSLWRALISGGATPCGLAARDTLRLEAGLLLYGQDMNEETSSLEANCAWLVKFEKDFIGKNALLNQKTRGLTRRLCGVKLMDKGVPRHGNEVFLGESQAGILTSATFSPTLKTGIGLAYLPASVKAGEKLFVLVHGRKIPAQAAPIQFYKGKIHA